MLNAIIVFFESLWCKHLKHFWSKIRWCRKRKEKSREVVTVDDAGLYPLLKDIYAHFEWTMDDWTELFDSLTPAPYLYNLYDEAKKTGSIVRDDCFTGDTKIVSLDGNSYSFKELVDNNVQELWVYSCTPEGKIVPAKAFFPRKKKTDTPLIKITLDTGEEIKCTENHLFMLRDGRYKKAKDIIPLEDSLMPGYFIENYNGYLFVRNNEAKRGGYIPVHRMVNEFLNPEEKAAIAKNGIPATHHKDHNRKNNVPENLEWVDSHEHSKAHLIEYNKSEEHRKKAAEMGPSNGTGRLIKYNKSQEHRELVKRMNRDDGLIKLRMRGKILGILRKVYDNKEEFTEENYRKYKPRTSPNFDTINKFFESKEEAFELARTYNHKIASIEYLSQTEEVYDITVPGTNNFLLEAGVFVHNCDGFHTIVYHILKNNGYNVALITCVTKPITKSHTMCLIKDDNGTYRVVDYTRVYRYPSIEKFVENYSTPVRFWCLDRYDYDKNVFYSIEPEEM